MTSFILFDQFSKHFRKEHVRLKKDKQQVIGNSESQAEHQECYRLVWWLRCPWTSQTRLPPTPLTATSPAHPSSKPFSLFSCLKYKWPQSSEPHMVHLHYNSTHRSHTPSSFSASHLNTHTPWPHYHQHLFTTTHAFECITYTMYPPNTHTLFVFGVWFPGWQVKPFRFEDVQTKCSRNVSMKIHTERYRFHQLWVNAAFQWFVIHQQPGAPLTYLLMPHHTPPPYLPTTTTNSLIG